MQTLHTLHKHITSIQSIDTLLGSINNNDILLLIEDGVYSLIDNTPISQKIFSQLSIKQLFCLEDDVIARGILALIPPHIPLIGYDDFVNLTEKNHRMISWSFSC